MSHVRHQRGHREDIYFVVIEHTFERLGVVGLQIFDIHFRDKVAGDFFGCAVRAQNLDFQIPQPPARKPPLPELAG